MPLDCLSCHTGHPHHWMADFSSAKTERGADLALDVWCAWEQVAVARSDKQHGWGLGVLSAGRGNANRVSGEGVCSRADEALIERGASFLLVEQGAPRAARSAACASCATILALPWRRVRAAARRSSWCAAAARCYSLAPTPDPCIGSHALTTSLPPNPPHHLSPILSLRV